MKVDRVLFAACVVLLTSQGLLTGADNEVKTCNEPDILKHLYELSEDKTKGEAVKYLIKAGPVVLPIFDMHKNDSKRGRTLINKGRFWRNVVPYWPKKQIGPILLKRFSKALPIERRYLEEWKRVRGKGWKHPPQRATEISEAIEKRKNAFAVLRKIAYGPAFEEFKRIAFEETTIFRRSDFLRAMVDVDPKKTSMAFTEIINNDNIKMLYELISIMYICKDKLNHGLVRALLSHPNEKVREHAVQRVPVKLSDVDILLRLLPDTSERTVNGAHKKLCQLILLRDCEREDMFLNKDRVVAWKKFWKERMSYTYEQLLEEALQRTLKRAKAEIDVGMIYSLWKFKKTNGVFIFLFQGFRRRLMKVWITCIQDQL